VIYEQHYDHTVYQCDCCKAIFSGRKAWLAELLKHCRHFCSLCAQAEERFWLQVKNPNARLPKGPVRKRIK
jgi:hypothetical protein